MRTIDLSVIVTNYNKPVEELMECMDSIKHQTMRPREVILVDDGSDDQRAHALATSIILPRNVGVAKARDIGVQMAKGELILFVDADDKLAPDFIQQSALTLAKADIAYPNMVLFTASEATLHTSPARLTPKHLMHRKCAIPVTSMMKRKVYDYLGGFRELPLFEDWEFWIRAMSEGFVFKRANTLLMYRQSAGSRVHQSRDLKNRIYREITAPFEIREGKICPRE